MKVYGRRAGLKQVDVGVRAVAPTYGKKALTTHVDKGGGMVVVDNNAERLVARMIGFDPRVRRFQAQPFAVDVVEGRLLRTAEQRSEARRRYAKRKGASIYTPDFLLELIGGRALVIEVKLEGFLGGPVDDERMAQATRVLATYGHDMARVVVPANTTHPLRSNLALLHHAAMRPDLLPSVHVIEQIEELAGRGARTLADYVTGLNISANLTPSLIVHGVLSADLIAHRIEGRMPVSAAGGCLDHLVLVERLMR
jgi:hypothetical protein